MDLSGLRQQLGHPITYKYCKKILGQYTSCRMRAGDLKGNQTEFNRD
jgi:hypothetical protein